jgi:hypothetical protein
VVYKGKIILPKSMEPAKIEIIELRSCIGPDLLVNAALIDSSTLGILRAEMKREVANNLTDDTRYNEANKEYRWERLVVTLVDTGQEWDISGVTASTFDINLTHTRANIRFNFERWTFYDNIMNPVMWPGN